MHQRFAWGDSLDPSVVAEFRVKLPAFKVNLNVYIASNEGDAR
jgi:hypothetical protein